MTREGCPACNHLDSTTLDRFLVLPADTPGKRGPRSLARDFGLGRRAIARHERRCLVGERREGVEWDIEDLADKAIRREYRRKEKA